MEGLGDGPPRARAANGMSKLEELTLAPWAKFLRYGLVPWKLLLQLGLVGLVTAAVLLRGATFAAYSRSLGRTWTALFFPDGYETFQSDFQAGAEYHIFTVNDTLWHAQRLVQVYYELPAASVDDLEIWNSGTASANGMTAGSRSQKASPAVTSANAKRSAGQVSAVKQLGSDAAIARGASLEGSEGPDRLREPYVRVYYNDGAPSETFHLLNATSGWPFAAESPLGVAAAGMVGPEEDAYISDYFARLERCVFTFQVRSFGWNDAASASSDVCLVWNVRFTYDFTVGGLIHVRNAYSADSRCDALDTSDPWYIFNACVFATAAILLVLIFKSAWNYLRTLALLRAIHDEVTHAKASSLHGGPSTGSKPRRSCLDRCCGRRSSDGEKDERRPLLDHEAHWTREGSPSPAWDSAGPARPAGEPALEEAERAAMLSSYHRLRSRSELCNLDEGLGDGPEPVDEGATSKLRLLVFGRVEGSALSSHREVFSPNGGASTGLTRPTTDSYSDTECDFSNSTSGLTASRSRKILGPLERIGSFAADVALLLQNWLVVTTAGCIAAMVFSGEVLSQREDDDAVGGADMHVSLGVAALCLWVGLAQFLEYVPQYYVLVQTLKRAAPRVGALLLGALPLFLGYMLLGMVLFGDQLDEFGSLGATFMTLFSCLNGDALLDEYNRLGFLPWIGTMYLTSFILLFTYVLLMSLIAVVEEAFFTAQLHVRRVRAEGALPAGSPGSRQHSSVTHYGQHAQPGALPPSLTASGRAIPKRFATLLRAAESGDGIRDASRLTGSATSSHSHRTEDVRWEPRASHAAWKSELSASGSFEAQEPKSASNGSDTSHPGAWEGAQLAEAIARVPEKKRGACRARVQDILREAAQSRTTADEEEKSGRNGQDR